MKLHIGNLANTTKKEDIQKAFESFGTITRINVVKDKETGEPRGFAFIEMDNADAAIAALDNQPMGGRNLKVNIAKAKTGGGGGGRW